MTEPRTTLAQRAEQAEEHGAYSEARAQRHENMGRARDTALHARMAELHHRVAATHRAAAASHRRAADLC
ncbi:hypothetical protein [Streptomyces sp. SGAir0957]